MLDQVTDQRMVGHEILPDGVRKTLYSGGTAIYVNYGGEPANVDGVRIPAMGYAVQ